MIYLAFFSLSFFFLYFLEERKNPPCLSHGGRDPHRAWATSSWMLYCSGLARCADRLLVNLLPSSQQFLSHCNPVESLLAFLASRWQRRPSSNKNFFYLFLLFSPVPFRLPLHYFLSTRFSPLISLPSIFSPLPRGLVTGRLRGVSLRPAGCSSNPGGGGGGCSGSIQWQVRQMRHHLWWAFMGISGLIYVNGLLRIKGKHQTKNEQTMFGQMVREDERRFSLLNIQLQWYGANSHWCAFPLAAMGEFTQQTPTMLR